jgi:branched-chain amino acid transport system permease protein
MDLTTVIEFVVIGILLGGLYALIASGLALILGVMKILNFAHGEFLMVAMYLTYYINRLLGLDPYIGLILGIPFMFLFGMAAYKVIISPVLLKGEVNQLLVTIGLSFFLQNLALTLFSSNLRQIDVPYKYAILDISGVVIQVTRLVAFGGSVCITLLLYLMLRYTEFGLKIQATSQNRDAATLMGIDVSRVYLFSFAIGIASVGVAGALLMPFYDVFPEVGTLFGLTAFFVVILGGMENLLGCLLAGLLLGITESVSSLFMPGTTSHLMVFCVFIAVLLFRPQGLLGRRSFR